jgi:calcineurin-like phosphoesterase family protein
MAKTFLIADTHFGHLGVCRFTKDDGTKLRPWTDYVEMDNVLVENWNRVVSDKDKVYLLGDVLINRRAFPTLGRLNGKKVLVKGNHDIFRLKEYTKFFYDIRAYHVLDNLLLSHIPVHPDSKGRFRGNIHGHLHSGRVKEAGGDIDPWYYCVSAEHLDYTPIDFEKVKSIFNN